MSTILQGAPIVDRLWNKYPIKVYSNIHVAHITYTHNRFHLIDYHFKNVLILSSIVVSLYSTIEHLQATRRSGGGDGLFLWQNIFKFSNVQNENYLAQPPPPHGGHAAACHINVMTDTQIHSQKIWGGSHYLNVCTMIFFVISQLYSYTCYTTTMA